MYCTLYRKHNQLSFCTLKIQNNPQTTKYNRISLRINSKFIALLRGVFQWPPYGRGWPGSAGQHRLRPCNFNPFLRRCAEGHGNRPWRLALVALSVVSIHPRWRPVFVDGPYNSGIFLSFLSMLFGAILERAHRRHPRMP